MLRGRIGGTGSPFNIGEASVARAAVRLATGETGFSYVLGRDLKKARLAAVCDALWQASDTREDVERHVLVPLRAARDRRRRTERARTAATKVDFFTLVRGEDER
jgi:alpha-D-ribose 1-methylphosphonate 5-triphosphate synthase subunit PhnG